MKILIWNIRGIRNPTSQRTVASICRRNNIKILVILEPLIPIEPTITRQLGFHNITTNPTNKIWCLSQSDCHVNIILSTEQILHTSISSTSLPLPIFCTFVYAKCSPAERQPLWSDLRSLYPVDGPWMVGGDFNIISHPDERLGGADPNLGAIDQFCDVIDDCNLLDLGYEGSPYTWTNNHLWQRLDRILVNDLWHDNIHCSTVQHLPRSCSDHSPLLLSLAFTSTKPPSAFRFYNMWTKHQTFLNLIQSSWAPETGSDGLINLQLKLLRLKKLLKTWN